MPTFGAPGPSTKCSLCGVSYTPDRHALPVPSSGAATPIPSAFPQLPSPRPPDPGSSPVSDPEGRISCPACTFLNHPSLRSCEICSTPLPGPQSPKPTINGNANGSTQTSPAIGLDVESSRTKGTYDIVRLSFRKGGVQEAYRRLKNVLSDQVWERQLKIVRPPSGLSKTTDSASERNTPRSAAGIDGIMQSIKLDSQTQSDHMQDAFRDLEVLMVRAGEMVKIAQSLNAKLTAQQSSGGANVTEADATLIRSSLVQLGLSAPALTQDMVRDERKYHLGLAQELGRLLTGSTSMIGGKGGQGLMIGEGGRGVIALDEVWGLWMRARGVGKFYFA